MIKRCQTIFLLIMSALALVSLVVGAWEFWVAGAPHQLVNGAAILVLSGLARILDDRRTSPAI